MLDDLILQPDDSTPIYQQLEHQLIRFIQAGRLEPEQALPSVRAIAAQLAVNPMTVSKAINRLVEQGWLLHVRGKPTRVATSMPQQARIDDQPLQRELSTLVQHARQLNISEKELVSLVRRHWKMENK